MVDLASRWMRSGMPVVAVLAHASPPGKPLAPKDTCRPRPISLPCFPSRSLEAAVAHPAQRLGTGAHSTRSRYVRVSVAVVLDRHRARGVSARSTTRSRAPTGPGATAREQRSHPSGRRTFRTTPAAHRGDLRGSDKLGAGSGTQPPPVSGRAPGSGGGPAMPDPTEAVDDRVLQLRGQGQAYARISRDLGLGRAADAQRAFRRALGRLPSPDAERVRGEERSRLDRLAERVRADVTSDDAARQHRLEAIAQMRAGSAKTAELSAQAVPLPLAEAIFPPGGVPSRVRSRWRSDRAPSPPSPRSGHACREDHWPHWWPAGRNPGFGVTDMAGIRPTAAQGPRASGGTPVPARFRDLEDFAAGPASGLVPADYSHADGVQLATQAAPPFPHGTDTNRSGHAAVEGQRADVAGLGRRSRCVPPATQRQPAATAPTASDVRRPGSGRRPGSRTGDGRWGRQRSPGSVRGSK